MKSLEQLRRYIYDFLDVEEFDISQDLLTAWAVEGYDKILHVTRRWPHFESSWELQATDKSVDLPDDLDTIELITFDGYQAEPIPLLEAQQRWPAGFRGGVSTPVCYTQRAGKLLIWPAPNGTLDIEIFGWRKPDQTWSQTAAGLPDMPEQLEGALLSFMLYRAYGHQGLIEDQQVERAEFDSQLREMASWESETPYAQPLILGGTKMGTRRTSPYNGPGPLIFPASGGV